MATKISSWLVAIGGVISFMGLCFLPAAFGNRPDKTMLDAGLTTFAMGVLLISGGLYLKARFLTQDQKAAAALSDSRRAPRSACNRCGKNEPVVQCRVHEVHLCADCLEQHYDFRSCAYVPSTRRGTHARAANA